MKQNLKYKHFLEQEYQQHLQPVPKRPELSEPSFRIVLFYARVQLDGHCWRCHPQLCWWYRHWSSFLHESSSGILHQHCSSLSWASAWGGRLCSSPSFRNECQDCHPLQLSLLNLCLHWTCCRTPSWLPRQLLLLVISWNCWGFPLRGSCLHANRTQRRWLEKHDFQHNWHDCWGCPTALHRSLWTWFDITVWRWTHALRHISNSVCYLTFRKAVSMKTQSRKWKLH